jgi:hypothetical protein
MTLEFPTSVLSLLNRLETALAGVTSEVKELRAESRAKPSQAATARVQYSVEEVAEMLGKSAYTVREWARHGQINAKKRAERRGSSATWGVLAEEIERIKNDGLLPMDPNRNRED